jgi:predicted ArsR family transcriptional regulator
MKVTPTEKSEMGRALKRVFRQDDLLKGVEEQPASISFLMNDIRRAIFLHLCKNPCDHVRGVARTLKMSAPGATWHLERLCDTGYVEKKTVGRKNVFWPSKMLRKSDVNMFVHLRKRKHLKVLKVVSTGPDGVKEAEIVTQLGVKQQNVNIWLKTLLSENLLSKEGSGRGAKYLIPQELIKAAELYRARAKDFAELILKLFETDGLRPKKPVIRGTVLSIELLLPKGNERLRFECNPLAAVGRILK